jgi:glycosyltransferase involved in cell wall biosynthesis
LTSFFTRVSFSFALPSVEKNPALLLQAAYHALQKYPFLRFRFIGDGHLKSSLELLSKRMNIDSAVEFIGWISSDQLPLYLSDLDIVVNPSLRGWSETFCISNIEVMSMGIPLITFGVGGNRFWVILLFSFLSLSVGIGEYVYPSTDSGSSSSSFSYFDITNNAVVLNTAAPEAMSDAILHLATNPLLARTLGNNGRESLKVYFTIERQMKQYENLYDAIFETLN